MDNGQPEIGGMWGEDQPGQRGVINFPFNLSILCVMS